MKSLIVIKIGSRIVLESLFGTSVDEANEVIRNLFVTVHALVQSGQQVVLVVSGAVGTGKREGVLETIQAQAARGQFILTTKLATFAPEDMRLALLLISSEDIVNRKRYLSLQETFAELLGAGVVPIVNENDATTIKGQNDFPDNDHLAAILSITLGASRVFLLTDVDGVYSRHPKEIGAELYTEIANVNKELLQAASGKGSTISRGGMLGKLQAARLATAAGITTHIINGNLPERIASILKGEQFGTTCLPRTHSGVELNNRDRWLMSAKAGSGTIQLDKGAGAAVRMRKSLLAVGVQKVYGSFTAGDCVEIVDHMKETIAIGLVNQGGDALSAMLTQTEKPYGVEIVHADNLILI